MLTSYLEKSMELWAEQQRVFREQTRTLMDNPMSVLTQIAERNLAMWQAMSGIGTDLEAGFAKKRRSPESSEKKKS